MGEQAEPTGTVEVLISIVDDDVSAREAVNGLVRSFGYAAAMFESTADFLRSDRLARTACLIADMRMPGMTGLELHAYLMASGVHIPTILISAYADAAAQARAVKAGILCCLEKPLNPDRLLACIRSAIGDADGRSR